MADVEQGDSGDGGEGGMGRGDEAGADTPPPCCAWSPKLCPPGLACPPDRLRASAPANAGEELKDESPAHIKGGRNRTVQLARTGKRRLFRKEAKREFLEWFAATANVLWSARKIGFCHQTVWKHRMNDPVFAEDFDRALDQATARVRAKLMESKATREPTQINGDYEAPELEDIDPQIALNLLREHERGRGGPAAGFGRKRGRRSRLATNAEVRAELVKRLKVFGIRVNAEQARATLLPLDGGGGVGVDSPSGTERAESPPPPPRPDGLGPSSPIEGEAD